MKNESFGWILLAMSAAPASFVMAAVPNSSWFTDLASSKGTVEFEAIGRPSALKIHGKGEAPKGKLTVKDSQVSGQVSFRLDSLQTGIALRDKHMKEKYLESEKFPEATLQITKIEPPGGLPS